MAAKRRGEALRIMSAYREAANAARLAWEYKVLTFKVDGVRVHEGGRSPGNAELVLNELGATGWEIAGIAPIGIPGDLLGTIVYTLKRLREE